ncbi:MAG: hypothetical protein ACO31X_11710, partial [Candidatus Nanopelagicales bacterium]
LLDALDEAYGDVIVAGSYPAARDLFLAIEGRVDAGVLVGEGPHQDDAGTSAGSRFLGFDVTEIDVMRLVGSYPRP